MEDNRTLKEKSFQNNMNSFLDELEDLDFYRLSSYLLSGFMLRAPDKIQEDFIDEFFGKVEWADYIYYSKKENAYILSSHAVACADILGKVKEYLLFKMNHRFIDLLSAKSKVEQHLNNTKIEVLEEQIKIETNVLKNTVLKFELDEAFKESIDENGVFWKDDGWCNVSDVLVKHKLLKLEEV